MSASSVPEAVAPGSETRPSFLTEFPCTLADARNAAIELRELLSSEGVVGAELGELELAIVEAANNAVNYVRESCRDLPVVMEAAVAEAYVDIRIWDHTEGFEMPEDVELPHHEDEGGRGLYLIKTLTDSAEYLRGKSANCFVLSKDRATPVKKVRTATVAQLEAELSLMTEELAASYESLSAIFSFSSTLAHASEPMDLIEPWMRELGRVTGADWYAFFIAGPDGRELVQMAASGEDAPVEIPLRKDRSFGGRPSAAARAVQGRQDVWFEATVPLSKDDPLTVIANGTSGLLHAVFLGSSLVGLVALGRRVAEHPFTAGQVNVIHTFSDFLGAQVRHVQVQRESTTNQLMRRDLEIAADIQQSLLPAILPRSPGLEIFGSATSAREVGGDFYDVIGFPDGSVLVAIADVMGKGVPAALFAAILRTLVRSRHDIAAHPGKLLEWVAATLFHDFDRVEMFATMQLVYFDTAQRKVHVAGAGHCPLLIAAPDGSIVEVPPEGVPVGIIPAPSYPESVHPISPNSRLLLFTDGVTESRDLSGDQWGMARLLKWITSAPNLPPNQLGTALLASIAAHRGAAPVLDDITFVLLTTHA